MNANAFIERLSPPGPVAGPEEPTDKPSEPAAWDGVLSPRDRNARVPQSEMTLASFVEKIFVPEHVGMKDVAGRTHYHAILKHVLTPEKVDRVFHVGAGNSKTRLKAVPNWPYLDNVRICDARPDDVQRLISAALARGYSAQTVTHIRNVVGGIFAHAKKKHWFTGENPASLVTLPKMIRKEAHALTLAQVKEVLGVMRYPEREMVLIAILTGMNVAEIRGLQWKRVNLTEAWSITDTEPIPPRTIAVRKQWRRDELLSVGPKGRNRNLPIPEALSPVLLELSRRAEFTGPDDFVFVSDAGTPLEENRITARRLKLIGKDLGMPWLSWHVFGRTRKSLAYELGMRFMLGYSDHAPTAALVRSDAGTLSH